MLNNHFLMQLALLSFLYSLSQYYLIASYIQGFRTFNYSRISFYLLRKFGFQSVQNSVFVIESEFIMGQYIYGLVDVTYIMYLEPGSNSSKKIDAFPYLLQRVVKFLWAGLLLESKPFTICFVLIGSDVKFTSIPFTNCWVQFNVYKV